MTYFYGSQLSKKYRGQKDQNNFKNCKIYFFNIFQFVLSAIVLSYELCLLRWLNPIQDPFRLDV